MGAGLRRLWAAPLAAHAGALAVVLLALVPVVGTSASFSADEGAAIIQARSLSEGEGWIVEHPLQEVDPTDRWYPLELSEKGPGGIAPFGKHPLYALLLAGADRVGGPAAMVALSVLGTAAAAFVAGLLGSRLGSGVARGSLWTVGLASPLLFDSFIVIAHSLGAAASAAAVLAAVRAVERGRARPAAVLAVAPLLSVAILLRTEAALFGLAIAVAFAGLGLSSRLRPAGTPARSFAAVAVVAGAATFATRTLETAWVEAVVGGPGIPYGPPASGGYGFLEGRITAFVQTWLRPAHPPDDGPTLLLLMAVTSLWAAALIVRPSGRRQAPRPGDQHRLARLIAATGAFAAVVALASAPENLVPGLVVAFPVGVVGLVVLDRATAIAPPAPILLAIAALFAAAVVATQHPTGGTSEWGGRYFALGLPLVAPVAVASLTRLARRIERPTMLAGLLAVSVLSAVLAVMAINGLRASHRFTDEAMTTLARTAAAAGTDVLVANDGLVPRLAWRTFDDQRWLLVPEAEMEEAALALRRVGVGRIALFTRDLPGVEAALGGRASLAPGFDPVAVGRWAVAVLDLP